MYVHVEASVDEEIEEVLLQERAVQEPGEERCQAASLLALQPVTAVKGHLLLCFPGFYLCFPLFNFCCLRSSVSVSSSASR